MLVCERNVSPSCRKKIITLPIKKVSKDEETEYFSMEVHKPESWDYCANALYVQNSLWVRFSRWITFSMMQQNFIKSSLAKREGFVGCHETNSLVERLQLTENNACKKYVNNTIHTLIQHMQINTVCVFVFVFFPLFVIFKALLLWFILQKYHMTYICQLNRNIGPFFKRSLLCYLLCTFPFPLF